MTNILITGTAGFIGFHLANLLLKDGFKVHGYDGITDYYDVKIKNARHNILKKNPNFSSTKGLLEDNKKLEATANKFHPDICFFCTYCINIKFIFFQIRYQFFNFFYSIFIY